MNNPLQLTEGQRHLYHDLNSWNPKAAQRYLQSLQDYRNGKRWATPAPFSRKNGHSREQIRTVVRMRFRGSSFPEISEKLGIPLSSCFRICQKNGVLSVEKRGHHG